VPEDVKGSVKVIATLEGWPFATKEDPTVVTPGANRLGEVLRQLFEKH
jgi:hypothetical protein